MNWHLVTYADENFVEQQKYLHQIHKEGFVHHPFNRKQLESTKFYKDNKKILDQDKGAGWWLWKPYYILEVLKKSKTNDFIIYSDCGDMFSHGLKPYIETTLNDNDIFRSSGSIFILFDEIFFPFNFISPESIFSKPAIDLRIVVLPIPEGPKRQIISPSFSIEKDTLFTLFVPPALNVVFVISKKFLLISIY